ncbi:glycosyltransferase family 4 protein [Ketobacter nezhaii]|uniref:glycosyltransferase family 4 protein n=1 Tax=Ketobacter sp. MCCC 1A13808 TaxID=2602738 RepID=UPI0018DC0D02|nr:glycosyltransferase family 4 protein [Ketobacter sp. MCCC 1A13808]
MKPKKHVAYLVPEYPVVSETFVYREIRVLISLGYPISTYALRENPDSFDVYKDGLPPAHSIYSKSIVSHICAFLVCLCASPKATFKTLQLFIHDAIELKGWQVKGKLLVQLFASSYLARSLCKKNVDHLHVHFIHSPAQVAMYASSLSGIPFTVTAHATDIYTHGQLLVEKSRRAKSVVTISEFNKKYLESIGVESSKISVIRCILDLPELDQDICRPDSTRGRFVFGSLGRLVRKKGFLTLLRAYKILLELSDEQPLELQIAGSGPQLREIESLIKELGIQNQVKLVGALHQSKVSGWMRNLDCFVLACEQDAKSGDIDGIPVVLMESMSYGIPSISTEVSGVPELVIDQITGLLAAPENPADLAQSMLMMISNVQLRSQMVVRAKSHVFDEFSKETNIERLVEVFET